MATFHVWHRNRPSFLNNDQATLENFPNGFTLVAAVETEHVSHVFGLTNHVEHDWRMNDGVSPWGGLKTLRSTSVGDVIVDRGESKRWTIEMIGLKEF